MKRIAIADIHLSAYKDDPLAKSGLPQRLNDLIEVIKSICDYARKKQINQIDILGDLHHDKNIIYTDAQNAFKDVILTYSDLNFLIFSGNHDLSSTGDYQTSSISAFEGYKNVKCYTQPVVLNNITIIPYSNEIVRHIKECQPNQILLSHFGLSEGQLQSGLSIVSDIKLIDVSKFDLVLLGHYHVPQVIKNDKTTLYYVGSPTHTNWNDKNQQKRFLVYDDETLEVNSVNINGYVQYREFNIDDASQSESIIKQADELIKLGHKVKIRNKTSEEIKSAPVDIIVINEGKDIDMTQRGLSSSMTKDEQLIKFLKLKQIDDKLHDKYLRIGRGCL